MHEMRRLVWRVMLLMLLGTSATRKNGHANEFLAPAAAVAAAAEAQIVPQTPKVVRTTYTVEDITLALTPTKLQLHRQQRC